MTQEDLIRMAMEAGLKFYEFTWTSPTNENLYPEGVYQEALEAFAKLVAAHERKACAQIAEEWLGPSKDREIHIAKAIRERGEQA